MKHFILFLTAVMFLANTITVSAWAAPCTGMDETLVMSKTTDMTDMPCHEDANDGKDKKNNLKHCDGLCLCLHTAITKTPVLSGLINLEIPEGQQVVFSSQVDHVVSFAIPPPYRPPKLTS